MKIIGFGNSTGSKSWRIEHPFKYLRRLGHEAYVSDEGITDKALEWADVVVLNSITHKEGIAKIRERQVEYGLKVVVDSDDWGEVNPDSPFKKMHELNEAMFVIGRTMDIADLVTCTTKHLVKQVASHNKNVKVLPNFMDLEFWDRPKLTNTSDKIRIGWAGSLTHLDDLKYIVPALKRIYQEYPVEYIFVGEQRIADLMKPVPVEAMLGVPFNAWPDKLHALRLDIGLAPLLDTPFNRNKTNIKWMEYGIAKVPGVYSPTVYAHIDFEPKYGVVAYDQDHWYRAIKHLIDYPQRRREIADNSYLYITKRLGLKQHIGKWQKEYLSILTQTPNRSTSVLSP